MGFGGWFGWLVVFLLLFGFVLRVCGVLLLFWFAVVFFLIFSFIHLLFYFSRVLAVTDLLITLSKGL